MLRGLSLIELLVTTAIMVVITGVVLANNSRFNSSVLLSNAAYDIALSVRGAQVFGISTREYAGQFNVGYGIHFASPTEYFLFADLDVAQNKRYDAGIDEIVEVYRLGRGHSILRYCGTRADLTDECSDAGTISHLDIAFQRPDPDSVMTSNTPSLYSRARVVVQSAMGETRTISIQSTGQISVSTP